MESPNACGPLDINSHLCKTFVYALYVGDHWNIHKQLRRFAEHQKRFSRVRNRYYGELHRKERRQVVCLKAQRRGYQGDRRTFERRADH